ncbi:MAG: 30S ribosome-binding factor RbfA [Lachnospiraceae bacterium]|nr:30S ribosome-binding factor RbfA [Lachnospiraceae bacterium]
MQNRRNNNRGSRINEAIKEEMALILRNIKDPRIDPLTSVVKVDTTRDLKYCKIYYSVLGGEEVKASTAEGLKAAAGYIRRELANRVNLRITPELTFIHDDSIAYSIYLGEKLKEIHAADEERRILYPEAARLKDEEAAREAAAALEEDFRGSIDDYGDLGDLSDLDDLDDPDDPDREEA